jgi:Tfp pilus assembly protein PilO
MSDQQANTNRLVRQIQTYARIQLILGGAAISAVVVMCLLIFRPQTQRLADLQRQIEFKNLELTSDRSQTDRLPRVTSELAALKRRLAGFKRLPVDPQFGQFIRDINQISEKAALRKFTEEPGAPRRRELFSEQPITISFQGGFPSVFQFVSQLEDMQRLTRVRGVTIQSTDDHDGTVDVKLLVNIYFAENRTPAGEGG